jgi:hypothetical protein
MMIRAGKLGCLMFYGGMFARRGGGMHGARVRRAVIRQCTAMTRQSGAVCAGRRAATTQSSARTRATSTHMSASAGSPAATPSARVAAARAPSGGARRASRTSAARASSTRSKNWTRGNQCSDKNYEFG